VQAHKISRRFCAVGIKLVVRAVKIRRCAHVALKMAPQASVSLKTDRRRAGEAPGDLTLRPIPSRFGPDHYARFTVCTRRSDVRQKLGVDISAKPVYNLRQRVPKTTTTEGGNRDMAIMNISSSVSYYVVRFSFTGAGPLRGICAARF